MRERDHDNLEYEGSPGEKATITVTAATPNAIVTFKIDGGATQVLAAGAAITFNLKNAGQRTDLQVTLDGPRRGRFELAVKNIPNCKNDPQHTIGACIDVRKAPPRLSSLYAFFAV